MPHSLCLRTCWLGTSSPLSHRCRQHWYGQHDKARTPTRRGTSWPHTCMRQLWWLLRLPFEQQRCHYLHKQCMPHSPCLRTCWLGTSSPLSHRCWQHWYGQHDKARTPTRRGTSWPHTCMQQLWWIQRQRCRSSRNLRTWQHCQGLHSSWLGTSKTQRQHCQQH